MSRRDNLDQKRILSHHCACPTNVGIQQLGFLTDYRGHVQNHESLLDAIRAVTGMYSVHSGLPGGKQHRPACSCISLDGELIARTVEEITEPELTVAVTLYAKGLGENHINIKANTEDTALLIYRTLSNAALRNPYNTMISSHWTIRLENRCSEGECNLMGSCIRLSRQGDGTFDISRNYLYADFKPEPVPEVPIDIQEI